MVDVWKELGKALGVALFPIAKIGINIWKGFGDASSDLIKGFMHEADDVKGDVGPSVSKMLPDVIKEATNALTMGSPPKEIKESVDKFVEQFVKMIEKESKTEGKSLPTAAELAGTQTKLIGAIIGMYAATHAISIALDATHPLKDWGFKTAIMDMLFQFKMSDVIGPMIQAPMWAAVVVPTRYRANSDYPYKLPDERVLPELVAKGIIDDKTYKTNMGYQAFDGTWSDDLVKNVYRYPSFSDLRTMIHRTDMTWEDAKLALEKSLIHTDYLDGYEDLVPVFPGLGDLITMMVREVITPEKFREMAGLMGLSETWADNYYDNHWILLPLGEVKKARHRGDITKGELDKFLVLHDYKPEPRPGIETSDADLASGLIYDRPGRIEARWLFRWGEIDLDELQELLEDAGLDPDWSPRVAKVVGMNQFLSDINRQVANIKADYAKGFSVEKTLRSELSLLGMRDDIVAYHVADALADRERGILDGRLRTLRSQYARGALTMAQILETVEDIIIDKEARDAWVQVLPTAKQVMILEETFGTEINRLVTNVKYDYVRGYVEKPALVSRLQLLDIPDAVIDFHVIDAEEDRQRRHNDKRLAIIEEGYIDDLIEWTSVEKMSKEIIVDKDGYDLYLDEVWLNKTKAKRVFEGEQ